MNMYEQFETDVGLETAGIWVDYGDFRISIARAGGANKKYLSYAEAKTKPFRRAIQAGTMPEDRSRNLLYDIYAKTVVLDWQVSDGQDKNGDPKWKPGIHKKGGGILEFSQENVVLTFKNLPALFLDLQQVADSVSVFRKDEMEEDSKNLQKS